MWCEFAGGVALCPAGSEASKELRRTAVEDQVGNVDATLVFVEGGDTFDAIGNVELATDESYDGFGLEGPETI